ncbi:hypothetical protein [Bifidobacterium callitrichidarum]|uniref:hypothetical protein n=1 Tax=Bifidobacterium callitrichidarum TaxID=2052941 RepID=UPI0011B1CA8E|nr:hypothetical protein [Bifidobacterium callitrichidarum]
MLPPDEDISDQYGDEQTESANIEDLIARFKEHPYYFSDDEEMLIANEDDPSNLNELESLNHVGIDQILARNPNYSENRLQHLMDRQQGDGRRYIIQRNICKRPNLSPEMLNQCLHWANTPADIYSDRDTKCSVALANNPNISPEVVNLIAKKDRDKPLVQWAALENQSADPNTICCALENLGYNPKACRTALQHKNADRLVVRSIIESHPVKEVVSEAFSHPALDMKDVADWRRSNYPDFAAWGAASRPDITPSLADDLNKNGGELARQGLAENPHTPKDLLDSYADGNDYEVAVSLADNPNIGDDRAVKILDRYHNDHLLCAHLIENGHLSKSVIDRADKFVSRDDNYMW